MNPDGPGTEGGIIDGIVGGVIGAVASGALERFVQGLAKGIEMFLVMLGTFWMNLTAPNITTSPAVISTSADLRPLVALIGIVCFVVGCGRLAWTARLQQGFDLLRGVIILAVVSSAGLVLLWGVVTLGDDYARAIISRATGEEFSKTSLMVLFSAPALQANSAVGAIFGLFIFLGAVGQLAFMLLRNACLYLIAVVITPVAAGAMSPAGVQRLTRLGMWALAFALYPLVAATAYAMGIRLVKAHGTEPVWQMLYGFIVLIIAVMALPALVKFLAPIAAAGASSMFSGAAVTGGVVAAGAAVVTLSGAGAGALGASASAGGAEGVSAPSGGFAPAGGPSGGVESDKFAGPQPGSDSGGHSPTPAGSSASGSAVSQVGSLAMGAANTTNDVVGSMGDDPAMPEGANGKGQ